MDILNNLSLFLGTSWTSGINLYMTIAGLGIMQRMGWVQLPGNLSAVANPFIILLAAVMYLVEFVADKIPVVDSVWDTIHTVIRPVGGAVLAFAAASNAGPAVQFGAALLSGTVAMSSHLTKATTRVAINSAPLGFTNSVASVAEDGLVLGVFWLILRHPIIASLCVIAFIVLSVLFLRMMFRFLRKVFSFHREPANKENLDVIK